MTKEKCTGRYDCECLNDKASDGLPFDPADVVVERYEDMTREQLISCCHAHDAHHQEHHKIDDAVTGMMAALMVSAGTFRAYEEMHRAKPDAAKADRNRDKAIICEYAVEQYQKTLKERTELPPFDPADVVVERYEDMTREQLISCCHAHDAHHQEHHKIDDAVTGMMAALMVSAGTFRAYEEMHRAKPDDAKADRNRDKAIICEYAVEQYQKTLKERTELPPCESCDGLGRIDLLPDDGTHTHPCEDCHPAASAEWQRGYDAALYNPDTQKPTSDEMQALWDMVMVQETGEQEASFIANWLRGAIKIPREVMIRIKYHWQPDTQKPAGDAALIALDWLLIALDMSHTEWCDQAAWRDDFKEKVETLRTYIYAGKHKDGGE